jgi:hypothetical protein
MECANYDILVTARTLQAVELLCVKGTSSVGSERMERVGDR